MSRVLVAVLLAVLVTGCGVRPSGVIPGLEAPTGLADPPEPPRTLYFVSDGHLVPVDHTGMNTDLVFLLAAGPDKQLRARGYTTKVPRSAAPSMDLHDSTGDVEVQLATDVARLSPTAVDQIVCTAIAWHKGAVTATLRGGGHTVDGRTCPAGR